MTSVNLVQSLTLPAVSSTDSGRPCPSRARWILVVGPLNGETVVDKCWTDCADQGDSPRWFSEDPWTSEAR